MKRQLVVLAAALSLLMTATAPGLAKPRVNPFLKAKPNSALTLLTNPEFGPRGAGDPRGLGKTISLGKISAATIPSGAYNSRTQWEGFLPQNWNMVGQVWWNVAGTWKPTCSGTLIGPGLVLTAGHCLYSQGQFVSGVAFVPGSRGKSVNDRDYVNPYGVWYGLEWWTTSEYAANETLDDWGIILLKTQNGVYPGKSAGWVNFQANTKILDGMNIYSLGYPATGYFGSAKGGLGRYQYGCWATWKGGSWEYLISSNDGRYELYLPCKANGGASGGPWLTQNATGSWVVIGVNNWCDEVNVADNTGTYCTPTSDFIRAQPLDSRFFSFYNYVLEEIKRL